MSAPQGDAAGWGGAAASLRQTIEGAQKELGAAQGDAERARKDLSRAEDRMASLVGLVVRTKAELDRVTGMWETCRGLQNELADLGSQAAPDPDPWPPGGEGQELVEITGARSIALMRILASDMERVWTAQEVAREYGLGDDLAHGARIARAGLDFLLKKNVLTKTHRIQDGIERTSYRITAPWTEA